MYYGVAYYPEHWPESRWATDAKLMREAGVNAVRMGEFAWSALEPTADQYDFEWLDRAVALLAEHDIETMMCTCSRTPPPRVFAAHPEILNVRADGRRANYGHRYTICQNNPIFRELAQTIDRAMVEHYAGNEHVIAWHIDNEIGAGNTCYCEVCRREFQAYVREKYGTLDALHQRWGGHFWSFACSDFSEIPTPIGVDTPNPALALEYARFVSARNVEFARWRYQLMKQLSPDKWVTTNFQTERADHTDIFDLGAATDVHGTNFYPPYGTELALDYCRGRQENLIVLEQRSGQPHWSEATPPGWMRLWAWRSLAHGAEGINFFRWRVCRWGQEQYWHAVLPHSGRPGRRYEELKQMGAEVEQLGGPLAATRPPAKTAVVMSYESRWAMKAVLRDPRMDALSEVRAYHEALMDVNVCTDAMDPREDLSPYSLVIAPRLYCVDQRIADNFAAFVERGGVLCLTPRSGVVDEYNTIFDQPAPGPLAKLAGVEVDDYGALAHALPLRTEAGGLEGVLEAQVWADEIRPTTARTAAAYAAGWQARAPAITINDFGRGKVVYVGTILREDSLAGLMSWLLELAGVDPVAKTPAGVRALLRRGDQEEYLFLLNFTDSAQSVDLTEGWEDALGGGSAQPVHVEVGDLRILRREV
jgi:beta-galactosidase